MKLITPMPNGLIFDPTITIVSIVIKEKTHRVISNKTIVSVSFSKSTYSAELCVSLPFVTRIAIIEKNADMSIDKKTIKLSAIFSDTFVTRKVDAAKIAGTPQKMSKCDRAFLNTLK